MSLRNQKGFSAVELFIIVLALAIVGFAGYMVYSRQQNNSASTSQSAEVTDVPAAPEINDAADLDAAEATLDKTDTRSTADSAELDAQLNSF